MRGGVMIRLVIALLFAVLLASCASKPIVPKPTIKSIAIVPATNPTIYTFQNRSRLAALATVVAGIGPAIAYSQWNKARGRLLTERIASTPYAPGNEFTEAMAASMRALGYDVRILENITRTPGDLDTIDYETLSFDADAVLHLYFSEVGIESPLTTTDYFPRLNASGVVYVKGPAGFLYDERLYYGVDARQGKSWAILADEKISFPNFDYALTNIESVQGAFSVGIREVVKRMSEQIHAVVK
jgi:hypothetical protein